MTDTGPAYGLWGLVLINSVVFIFFALTFFKPQTPRDWRSFGLFSAFIVALFAEMYGFPLTLYFLSGWLQSRYPDVSWLSHDAGHLLEMLFGWKANPHMGPFHIASYLLIFGGFYLIAIAWPVLYEATKVRDVGHNGTLRLCPTSAVCGFHRHSGRLLAAMADAANVGNVSCSRLDVRALGQD